MDRWPLVGRSKELTQLAGAVADQRGAVITGAAGVGKTTLATAYLELARNRGMAVARSSATRASQALPFGALAPFLPSDPGGDGLATYRPGSRAPLGMSGRQEQASALRDQPAA